MISGIFQSAKGKKEAKKATAALEELMRNRPGYQIPKEAQMAVQNSENALNAGSADVDVANRQAQIAATNSMANAQRNAGSGAEAIQAAANAQQGVNANLPQLARIQMGTDAINRQGLQGSLMNMQNQRENVMQDKADANQMWQSYRAGQLMAANMKRKSGEANIQNGLSSNDAFSMKVLEAYMGTMGGGMGGK